MMQSNLKWKLCQIKLLLCRYFFPERVQHNFVASVQGARCDRYTMVLDVLEIEEIYTYQAHDNS